MKKLLILLGFVAVLSTVLSSCSTSRGGCPAYGQVDTEQQDANV